LHGSFFAEGEGLEQRVASADQVDSRSFVNNFGFEVSCEVSAFAFWLFVEIGLFVGLLRLEIDLNYDFRLLLAKFDGVGHQVVENALVESKVQAREVLDWHDLGEGVFVWAVLIYGQVDDVHVQCLLLQRRRVRFQQVFYVIFEIAAGHAIRFQDQCALLVLEVKELRFCQSLHLFGGLPNQF